MRPRRKIEDEEYRQALANQDNANIIRSETTKYSKCLSKQDLSSCGLIALWRALQYHIDGLGQKFTTSLYRFIHWECRRELRKKMGKKHERVKTFVPLTNEHCRDYRRQIKDGLGIERELKEIKEVMKDADGSHQEIIEQCYFQHMTMEEIGRANGYSKETARHKLKQAVVAVKGLCRT